jgi:nucleotide-binding universal stress UspA family protein
MYRLEMKFRFTNDEQACVYILLQKLKADYELRKKLNVTKAFKPTLVYDSAQEIQKAKTEKVDYIVVGTHGRTGLAHVVMGSTAEYIVRHATMPVMVVPMK